MATGNVLQGDQRKGKAPRAPWRKKYEVVVTRLIEQEVKFFVDAVDESAAQEQALDEAANEVGTMCWDNSDAEPHTYTVESVKRAE